MKKNIFKPMAVVSLVVSALFFSSVAFAKLNTGNPTINANAGTITGNFSSTLTPAQQSNITGLNNQISNYAFSQVTINGEGSGLTAIVNDLNAASNYMPLSMTTNLQSLKSVLSSAKSGKLVTLSSVALPGAVLKSGDISTIATDLTDAGASAVSLSGSVGSVDALNSLAAAQLGSPPAIGPFSMRLLDKSGEQKGSVVFKLPKFSGNATFNMSAEVLPAAMQQSAVSLLNGSAAMLERMNQQQANQGGGSSLPTMLNVSMAISDPTAIESILKPNPPKKSKKSGSTKIEKPSAAVASLALNLSAVTAKNEKAAYAALDTAAGNFGKTIKSVSLTGLTGIVSTQTTKYKMVKVKVENPVTKKGEKPTYHYVEKKESYVVTTKGISKKLLATLNTLLSDPNRSVHLSKTMMTNVQSAVNHFNSNERTSTYANLYNGMSRLSVVSSQQQSSAIPSFVAPPPKIQAAEELSGQDMRDMRNQSTGAADDILKQ